MNIVRHNYVENPPNARELHASFGYAVEQIEASKTGVKVPPVW
jgi:hypothetical protein